jgi:DNA modification methylase
MVTQAEITTMSDKGSTRVLFNEDNLSEEVRAVLGEITACMGGSNAQTSEEAGSDENSHTHLNFHKGEASDLYGRLQNHFQSEDQGPSFSEIREIQGAIPQAPDRLVNVEKADACKVHPSDSGRDDDGNKLGIQSDSVNLIVTSPPYWQLRDYGMENQLGQEDSPEEYVEKIVNALDQWEDFLHPQGSIFLNIGDKYKNKSLVGIPGMFAERARKSGWTIRNQIIWSKDNGIPSPAKDRLVPRHEHIFHLVPKDDYYYDLFGYSQVFGNGSNPGDVWNMNHDQNTGDHLAPFPRELVFRAVTLACPPAICPDCGTPHTRQTERPLKNLNPDRPQAQRALEKYDNSNLNKDHLRAIRAVGISDAGKAKEIQDATGSNDDKIQELADEAKEVLGGYFREFTFPLPKTASWSGCDCDTNPVPGLVFDPFAGSGTTINAAYSLGYQAWGTDLDRTNFELKLDHFTD